MKVSGFSFIRNAIKYDYPIVEAITSILPLCDEFVVAFGNSDDETEKLIRSIDSEKIRIIPTVWDDSLREGGAVLAVETNKAFDAISADSDWCFYIQGDEAIHEQDFPKIKEAMLKWKDHKEVEGLLFNYRHFYGSYDYIGDTRRWYRKEIRIIRNDKRIRSYKDAQGFRIEGRKLNVKPVDAHIHHYGWVKDPRNQQQKALNVSKFWHSDEWINSNIPKTDAFDYSEIDSLQLYKGTHPKVMQPRIEKLNWKFEHDVSKKKYNFKIALLTFIEKTTGYRVGEYKNYKVI